VAWAGALLLAVAAVRNPSYAAEEEIGPGGQRPATEPPDAAGDQPWNLHGQATVVGQGYPRFSAPYSGPNSLRPGGELRETISLDLMGGVRLWRGAEFYLDGLMWQGFGLSRTLGIAGFPNGEAFKVGTGVPNVNLDRAFLRWTIGLGGEQEAVEDAPFQLAGRRQASRLTFTVGKLSAKDIFDNNAYANDPRTQFLNWSLMANGAWDYPADALGFIPGAAVELYQPQWTARYGVFMVPGVANGLALDWRVLLAWSMAAEVERRYALWDRPGKIRLLGYLTRAHMGSYELTLADPSLGADIALTRNKYRHKFGFGINLEQEVSGDLGVFLRAGWSDGRHETWMFTEVDRTVSLGVSLRGGAWGRPQDTVGVAGALNGLSGDHRAFLAAGGLGLILGDARLNYRVEQILEAYYSFNVAKHLWVGPDYQFVRNPGHNADRGPVHVLGLRLHIAF
jgi:high affinity Mn2+ porin